VKCQSKDGVMFLSSLKLLGVVHEYHRQITSHRALVGAGVGGVLTLYSSSCISTSL
jgi:hypothetical protein